MKISTGYLRACLACAAAGSLLGASPARTAESRLLDVEAMLRIAEIGDSAILGWRGSEKTLAHVSPNGKQAVVVVQAGNPDKDTIDGRLLLFDMEAIRHSAKLPAPEVIATFSSGTNYQPIGGVRWLDDHSLMFAGVDGNAPTQVYRLDVRTRTLAQVTREVRPVAAFAPSDQGNGLLVLTQAAHVLPRDNPQCVERGCLVPAGRLTDAINGSGTSVYYPGNVVYYVDMPCFHSTALPSSNSFRGI